MDALKPKIRISNNLLRECLAECLGTFILMVFGNGSVAQVVLSKETAGTYISINWAFGLGVTMAVYVSGGVSGTKLLYILLSCVLSAVFNFTSGGHINPSISFTNCVLGRLPWRKLPFYVFSQMLGAFISGAVVYGIYYDALNAFDGGVRQVYGVNATAGIFSTYPQPYLSILGGFMDQVFGTALLSCCILGINDKFNNKPPTGLEPLIVGFLVFAIGTAYGYNCGYAINPARDFGPRLFTAVAGWGSAVFFAPNGQHWWWVPIIGPLVGAVLGAIVYLLFIESHWPRAFDSELSLEEITGKDSDEKESHVQLNKTAKL